MAFSASPALPDGMSIDPKTGVITGTTSEVLEERTYTIVATGAVFGVAATKITMNTSASYLYRSVEGGGDGALALGSDGNVYSWGGNQSGQLGTGTTTARSTPGVVLSASLPVGVRLSGLAAGSQFAVALGSDGKVYSWD